MAWKRYRTETGAHVTLNYTADGLIELPAEPALDANGRPRPATYPQHSLGKPEEPETTTEERCHEFHRH